MAHQVGVRYQPCARLSVPDGSPAEVAARWRRSASAARIDQPSASRTGTAGVCGGPFRGRRWTCGGSPLPDAGRKAKFGIVTAEGVRGERPPAASALQWRTPQCNSPPLQMSGSSFEAPWKADPNAAVTGSPKIEEGGEGPCPSSPAQPAAVRCTTTASVVIVRTLELTAGEDHPGCVPDAQAAFAGVLALYQHDQSWTEGVAPQAVSSRAPPGDSCHRCARHRRQLRSWAKCEVTYAYIGDNRLIIGDNTTVLRQCLSARAWR